VIAKRIQRKRQKTQAQSDKGLFAYVGDEANKGRGDPTTWRLSDYTVDKNGVGEKVESVRITNCESSEYGWAVKEILATQARNTRSKTDKSYHLVISFPDGEKPTPEQLIDIENEAVKAIGLQDHQRISAVHINTDHYHLHVAINKVHPKTLRNVEPWYDHYRLQEVCIVLEKRHGLTVVNHAELPDRVPGKIADLEAQAGIKSFATWAKETAAEAIIEAARDGKSWADMHAALAQFNIAIRPRGAGLVIVHRQDERWRVKASDVARELAFKVLTDKWGPFEPAAGRETETPAGLSAGLAGAVQAGPDSGGRSATAPAPPTPRRTGHSYAPDPLYQAPGVKSLWERYQAERAALLAEREVAVGQLRAGHVRHGEEVAAYFKARFEAAKSAQMSRADRMDAYKHIRDRRRKSYAERVERERAERSAVRKQHSLITWHTFLERESALGDVQALKALRSRMKKRRAVWEQIIGAADEREALDIVRAHMKPTVGRSGDVFYNVADGGAVTDGSRYVVVSNATTGAILLAVDLAKDKFAGSDLIVTGTEDFAERVKLAGEAAGVVVRVRKVVEKDIGTRHKVLVETDIGVGREQHNGRGVTR
jgi:hypothetical protein